MTSTSQQYGLQSRRFPGPERRPSGDQDKERDRDRDKERGENGARPREHHKESRGGRLELLDLEPMDTSDPATQIMTNNYDMPILTESSQLSPSLSPDLEPVDTVHPAESLPHKFVSEKADPTPTHFITVSPKKKLVLGRMVEPPVSHPAPPSPEKRSRKLAMERRQRQKRDQQSQSNWSLFPDVWTEENNRALRTSRAQAAVPLPLELRLLQGVPDPPQRRQHQQLPHRGIEIPLDPSLHEMQDPRRSQPPAKFCGVWKF